MTTKERKEAMMKLSAERVEDELNLTFTDFYNKYKGYPTMRRSTTTNSNNIAEERLLNWPAANRYIPQNRRNILDITENIIVKTCQRYIHLE